MRRLVGWILGTALVVALAAQSVLAEPYLAVREGFKCSDCHVNKTGGGKRTEFVSAHARDLLHYPSFFAALAKPADSFTGELVSPYVAIGADLRTDFTATFQDKPDANGKVSNNTAFRSLDQTDINVNEAVGYLEVRLIPDWLTFYVDQRFAPSTTTREAWGLLNLPWDLYIKGGKMFLPYGLELQDDDAFIRGGRNGSVTTGFSFNQQQNAFEVGWEPGPVAAAFAVSEGAANDNDLQVTGTVYSLFTDLPVVRNFLIGGSASHVSPPGIDTLLFGFFTGFDLGPLTYLGEVDFRSDKNRTDGNPSTNQHRGRFIHYSELDWLALDWMNVKLAFDYADDDGDLTQRTNDSENRVSFGIEPFLAKFLQTRLFYRIGNGIESNPSHNQDVLMAEVHVFF
jgi:hypothetical protein